MTTQKKLIFILLLIALVVVLCGNPAIAETASDSQSQVDYSADENYYSFLAFDQNITYQDLDFMCAIPVSAGDLLDVNVSMTNNSSYICVDPEGLELYIKLIAQNATAEEMAAELVNHTVYNFSVFNSMSYNAQILFDNDTYFCLVVAPWDLEQLPTGHIKAVRYSKSDVDICPGFNGSVILATYYEMLKENEEQQTDQYPETDGLDWVPDTSTVDYPSSNTDDGFYLGNITGPDLSSTSTDDQNISLGLATGIPITGPTGDYTPYYSSAYSSSYLNEEFQEAQDSWHKIEMERVEDDFNYFDD